MMILQTAADTDTGYWQGACDWGAFGMRLGSFGFSFVRFKRSNNQNRYILELRGHLMGVFSVSRVT